MNFGGTVLGTYKAERNGKEIEYNIEVASRSMKDEMIEHMKTEFLPRENLSSSVDLIHDAVSVRCFERWWNQIVDSGTAVVAVMREPQQKPVIMGMNMTYISESIHEEFEGEATVKIAAGLSILKAKSDISERFNVNIWLDALGLSVGSTWHGYRIAERILGARDPLCKLLDLRASFTVFTAPAAIRAAEKAGMETLAALDCGEIRTSSGQRPFYPRLKGVVIKGMGKIHS